MYKSFCIGSCYFIVLNKNFSDIYELAKSCRFLRLSELQIDDIRTTINGSEISLTDYETLPFTIAQKNVPPKTAFINISWGGEKTWDYNYEKYQFTDTAKRLFDQVITIGTGANHLSLFSDKLILEYNLTTEDRLQLIQSINLGLQQLPKNIFTVICFSAHGSEDDLKLTHILESLPDDLNDESIVIINSCYAGRYADMWNKKYPTLIQE